jgi:linearmycin/streptolysin S transport system permease protein
MRTVFNVIAAASAANGASTARDQRRLAVLFLMPVAVMAIIGIAMGGYSQPALVVGILDRAETGASRELISTIAANPHMRIRGYTEQQKMRIAVFRGRLNAGVIIPSGWTGVGDLDVYLSPASAGSPVIRAAIDADLSRLANRAKPFAIPIHYPGGGGEEALPLGFQYTAPANLVLFVMINGFVSAIAIIRLRTSGLSQRLLATPARTWELFAMLTVGPFQQMIVQSLFLILTARWFFGVHWGDSIGVFLLTTSLICFGVSLVFLMGTIFRSPEQPSSLGPWIGVFLGMLGGCMWPLEVVPPFMRTVAYLSPAAWAMDGYRALIFSNASAIAILPDVAAMFLLATAFSALGIFRLRRQFSR